MNGNHNFAGLTGEQAAHLTSKLDGIVGKLKITTSEANQLKENLANLIELQSPETPEDPQSHYHNKYKELKYKAKLRMLEQQQKI